MTKDLPLLRQAGILLCALFLALFLCPQARHASAADGGRLQGEAFSPHRQTQEMPPGWEELPMRYDAEHTASDLVVVINQQFYDLLAPPIGRFSADNSLDISIVKGTCGISAARLSGKSVDIGAFCCPPTEPDRLPGLRFHTLGIHSIALLVHASNPVESVTLEEARAIFQGGLSGWEEVGGPKMPIQVVGRLHCKKRPGHWRLLLDNEDLFSPTMTTVGGVEDMFRMIAVSPGSIGWEVHWLVDRYTDKVRALRIDDIPPGDLESLKSGRYPLYRVLFLTTWDRGGEHSRTALQLIRHLENEVAGFSRKHAIVPKQELLEAGWKFMGDELIGGPAAPRE